MFLKQKTSKESIIIIKKQKAVKERIEKCVWHDTEENIYIV